MTAKAIAFVLAALILFGAAVAVRFLLQRYDALIARWRHK